MTAILSLLLVLALSILVTRVASIVLTHTGMSRQAARFQARSAFSGAGFTTAESEQVVTQPVRRRVVQTLMLLGNAGIVTAVSSLILAFVQERGEGAFPLGLKIGLLVAGILALWVLANSALMDRLLSRLVDRLLARWTDLDVHDYAGLLHLGGDYRIAELGVDPDGWLAGRTLHRVRPAEEGILVLGIARPNGEWFGTPRGDTRLNPGDTLVVYGRTERIRSLQERRRDPAGERERRAAVGEQAVVAARERGRETERPLRYRRNPAPEAQLRPAPPQPTQGPPPPDRARTRKTPTAAPGRRRS